MIITTKYLPATNTLGSRFKATCSQGSVTTGYDYTKGSYENHFAVCEQLLKKLQVFGEVVDVEDTKTGYLFAIG